MAKLSEYSRPSGVKTAGREVYRSGSNGDSRVHLDGFAARSAALPGICWGRIRTVGPLSRPSCQDPHAHEHPAPGTPPRTLVKGLRSFPWMVTGSAGGALRKYVQHLWELQRRIPRETAEME